MSHISLFDRKILIFMTSFNWKKFAHLNISPQTNGKMKNRVRQWNGVGGWKERESKTESKTEWKSRRVTKSDRSVGIWKGRRT